jgi:hypothetical protein
MSNQTVLKKDSTKDRKPGVNQTNKKNITPDKVAEKKQKAPTKKSSALLAASVGRSAVNQVKSGSSRDGRGSSGGANVWAVNSYD